MFFNFGNRDARLSVGVEQRFQKEFALARNALWGLVFALFDQLIYVKIVRRSEGEATGEQEVKKYSQRPNVNRGAIGDQSSQHFRCSVV